MPTDLGACYIQIAQLQRDLDVERKTVEQLKGTLRDVGAIRDEVRRLAGRVLPNARERRLKRKGRS